MYYVKIISDAFGSKCTRIALSFFLYFMLVKVFTVTHWEMWAMIVIIRCAARPFLPRCLLCLFPSVQFFIRSNPAESGLRRVFYVSKMNYIFIQISPPFLSSGHPKIRRQFRILWLFAELCVFSGPGEGVLRLPYGIIFYYPSTSSVYQQFMSE